MEIDRNVKMWCSRCQASTKGDHCDFCRHGFTVCIECGYCFGCLSTVEQRTAGEDR